MNREPEDLEELVRALELVWIEKAALAQAYQAEAAELWRVRATQDKIIVDLRRELEEIRAAWQKQMTVGESLPELQASNEPEPGRRLCDADEFPSPHPLSPELSEQIAQQREEITRRKDKLSRTRAALAPPGTVLC